ncbi:hypothetical protein [Deinococcus yunweiensis]|uniref:hypothetical protein n=1 Tax=Deinococcus yunweiensis TaxID=367282 RepID=UPI00398F5F8A
MIESIQRTDLQCRMAAGGAEWDGVQPILRHRTVAGEDASAVDVTYQLELHSDSTPLLQLEVTYHVVFQTVDAVDTHAAQDATWPYFRMDAVSQSGPVGGALLSALPVINPLRPVPVPTPVPSGNPAQDAADWLLPDTVRTDLQVMAALHRVARRDAPWLRAAAQVYLVLNLLSDRRRRWSDAEQHALALLLQEEVGCTVEELLAVPAPAVRRYRDMARALMIVATHAVMETQANVDTGQIEDEFSAAVSELFSSDSEPDDAPPFTSGSSDAGDDPDAVPPQVAEALKALVLPVLTPVEAYRHHRGQATLMVGEHNHTVVAYGTGYDYRMDARSENVGHTAHLVAVYVTSESADGQPLILNSIEDVSEEFETWAVQHDFMGLQEVDRQRLQHALHLDQQTDDQRTRTFTEAGAWATAFPDIRALNKALSTLDLSAGDFHDAATLIGINLGILATRPDCPASLLGRLARHPDPELRADVAEHASTPEDALYDLDQDHPAVRRALARNPSLPVSLQRQYVHAKDEALRANVAQNPSLDVALLAHLAEDPSLEVRFTLTRNPSTPEDVLRTLLDDENEAVGDMARKTLDKRWPDSKA